MESHTIIRLIYVMNEQHSLLPDQTRVLEEWLRKQGEALPQFTTSLERWDIPAEGLRLSEIEHLAQRMANTNAAFVLVSPIPALFVALAAAGVKVSVLHNDNRCAKEVPTPEGGVKIVHTIAPTGWVLY